MPTAATATCTAQAPQPHSSSEGQLSQAKQQLQTTSACSSSSSSLVEGWADGHGAQDVKAPFPGEADAAEGQLWGCKLQQ